MRLPIRKHIARYLRNIPTNKSSEGTISVTFTAKKRTLSGGFLLIFLCFRPKRASKKSAPNPDYSDTRVSLVSVLPKARKRASRYSALYHVTGHVYNTCFLGAFSTKRSENEGVNENLLCGFPSIPGIAPGVAPRTVVFVFRAETKG